MVSAQLRQAGTVAGKTYAQSFPPCSTFYACAFPSSHEDEARSAKEQCSALLGIFGMNIDLGEEVCFPRKVECQPESVLVPIHGRVDDF